MEMVLIQKSIQINASKERIWDVLTRDENNRKWFEEFGAGTFAVTDWKEGSKVLFMDNEKSGLSGLISVNNPGKELIITYKGIVADGLEDYESEMAKNMDGYREVYRLTPEGSEYRLDIESDMGKEYFDFMSEAWDRALVKVKALSEENETSH